jgi:hypothetical protein
MTHHEWTWVEAPWTDDEVAFLNAGQRERAIMFGRHPYTCAFCRDIFDMEGILEARNEGWWCLMQDRIVQTQALLLRAVPGPFDHIALVTPGSACEAEDPDGPCVCARGKDHTGNHECLEPTCARRWL